MKKLIFLLALCISLTGQAQTLKSVKQDLQKVIDQVDALIKAQEPKPEEPKGDSCKRGPVPQEVYNITQKGATVLFDADEVYGWDFTIYQDGAAKESGKVSPKSNREQIVYSLDPGNYVLALKGNTCLSKVYTKPFTIPKPAGDNGGDGGNSGPPPVTDKTAKFQLILGTTGSGFQSHAEHGIDPQWVDRIEAFKYSWGYGITGICVWVAWDGYEKTKGVYEEEAFKRVIKFCKDRGLTLSVAFMGRRHQYDAYDVKDSKGNVIGKDYFIRDNEIIKGSNGTLYYEGVPGFGNVYASYGNDRVNGLMVGAIQSIAKLMKTYDKSFYMAIAGGGAGEQVNHTWVTNGIWETADFCEDNLNRFNEWATRRGIASPGIPPIIQGPGIDWPHPDYNNPRGLEFGRFTTYGIYKYYKNFVDAVKSVSNQPCLFFYSVTSNRQFRAIQDPNLNFIASPGDGMYGSDGVGLGDLVAKYKVNSLNLGTFPNGISATEVDPHDISPVSINTGRDPYYCEGGLNYEAFLKLSRDLYGRGLQVMHLAMSFCEQEGRGFEPVLKVLHQEYIGKPYVRPTINASNTVTVEVTEKYRNSIDLMEGINPYTQYTKYTDCNFWGPVKPEGATNCVAP